MTGWKYWGCFEDKLCLVMAFFLSFSGKAVSLAHLQLRITHMVSTGLYLILPTRGH